MTNTVITFVQHVALSYKIKISASSDPLKDTLTIPVYKPPKSIICIIKSTQPLYIPAQTNNTRIFLQANGTLKRT